MDKIYGLLGRKLGHSHSVPIHNALGNPNYRPFELEPSELGAFVRREDIGGLNVTIPYKRDVMKFCDEISSTSEKVGSVNTLVRRGGKLIGHNTDLEGFMYMLRRAGIDPAGKKAVVLGSGGTSLTATAALKLLGAAETTVVSRSGKDNYENLSRHADAQLIVNATPVGMYPDNGISPVSLDAFPECLGVADVIYNPLRTDLLIQAEQRGIPCSDGLPMLVAQAAAAHKIFFDTELEADVTESILTEMYLKLTNIVLIGMPGSGKTVIGRALAELSGRRLIDTDDAVAQAAGMSVPEIINTRGEEYFRRLEHEAVCKAGKNGGIIISTGGGTVTREENYAPLHQNGRIYCIETELSSLATEGRPLSGDANRLSRLYEERRPMYARFADASVKNDGTPLQAAEIIRRDFHENTCNKRP